MIFKLTRSIVVFVTSKSVVIHLHKMYPSKYLDKTFIVEWLLRDWLISVKLKIFRNMYGNRTKCYTLPLPVIQNRGVVSGGAMRGGA